MFAIIWVPKVVKIWVLTMAALALLEDLANGATRQGGEYSGFLSFTKTSVTRLGVVGSLTGANHAEVPFNKCRSTLSKAMAAVQDSHLKNPKTNI